MILPEQQLVGQLSYLLTSPEVVLSRSTYRLTFCCSFDGISEY